MKKYLFLLLLLIIYIFLNVKPVTKEVSYDVNNSDIYINSYKLKFPVGINSNDLINKISNYDKDILINKINNIDVKCENINDCIKQFYQQMNEEFIMKNISSFKIDSIEFISYESDIKTFLENENLITYIKK